MKSSELRIGNYLLGVIDRIECISELQRDKVETIFRGHLYNYSLYEDISPIELTNEIFEKVGFKKTIEDYYFQKHIWINNLGFKIAVDDIDFAIDIPHNKTGIRCDILYLHQLQNLYFALTGQELNIEL